MAASKSSTSPPENDSVSHSKAWDATSTISNTAETGPMLAATARDGTFRIWDTAPRLPLGPRLHFDDTQSRLTALAFTPDGDSLVTGGPQDTAIVWDLDPERLIDRACDLAGRNLTRGEWELYMPEGTPYRKTCPQWPEPPDG